MYVPVWVLVALLVGWYVYRYYAFKERAAEADREAAREADRLDAELDVWEARHGQDGLEVASFPTREEIKDTRKMVRDHSLNRP